ncbi:N-acetylglucosamine-1-phosphotransferase subunits alpha/beta-like isoform X1 [Dreissena polymorpha]|uniref:N-acetylglucosamine-1-phosphotransferase subunits alpha/beta-like isoform X1 n=1 Tax=Dreissena polymorpha TaxID=45954 RepID=UPI00226505F6|nr:N-acetylglucosamine-1-phosphotransferase subunits alpha/beta-like isoform X1 [Dreissena polymorpha]
MENSNWRKLLQKQFYDVLSHRYGLLVLLVGAIVIVVSAFHFGETVVEWSTEKYASVFNSFSDNLAGKSYRERLCLPVPIDVVYTWVNGTDPQLIRNLKRVKLEMQDQLNISRIHKSSSGEVKCVFSNCVRNNMVVLSPGLSGNVTLTLLKVMHPEFHRAMALTQVTSPLDLNNYTVVAFADRDQAADIVNRTLLIKWQNTSIIQGYITSDGKIPNAIELHDQILMLGFPHTLTVEELRQKLPEKHRNRIEKLEIDTDKGVAVLYAKSSKECADILSETNFTIDGKEPTLSPAHFVWDLRDFARDEDISASRFEDNEELRYSLRSLERFAPWVRHVFIVTNGQLPYWLNLENPHVSIVTHEEIFANESHLPTFSSPAIESNLHRIPGLSDKFVYMNDDVMFGKEVWPDDFYSHSSGQKVYLTWPVPNCNEGCPQSWIRDGYCDKACNVSECEWDAGDCDGTNPNAHHQGGWAGSWHGDTRATGYCHSGCANNWIADRYCDTACNVLECGFDAGDCGTSRYFNLHGMMLTPDVSEYTLPAGLAYGYFNLTSLLVNNFTLKGAFYDDNKAVRTIAVAKKFSVLTIVCYSNMSSTRVNFSLELQRDNRTSLMNFSLNIDTSPQKTVVAGNKTMAEVETKNVSIATNKTEVKPTEETILFPEIPKEQISPKVLPPTFSQDDPGVGISPMPANLSLVPWPDHLQDQFDRLTAELEGGEITQAGFDKRMKVLWKQYQKYLLSPDAILDEQKRNLRVKDQQEKKKKIQDPKKPAVGLTQKTPAGMVDPRDRKKMAQAAAMKEKLKMKIKGLEKEKNAAVDDGKLDNHNDNIIELVEDKNEKENHPHKSRNLLAYFNESLVFRGINELEDDAFATGLETVDSYVEDVDIQPDTVRLLPWEKGSLADLQQQWEKQEAQASYQYPNFKQRHLMDTFGDSLRHVNFLYNKAFGYTARKVPGHMPHMIDKNIMAELQERFPDEWAVTSSHKVRHSKDMQFAFAYFYYLMGVKQVVTAADVFREMDTDNSLVLSDREIRTLATRLYDLPLDLQTLTSFEFLFVNCSRHLSSELQAQPGVRETEMYYEKDMPQVTRNLFVHCPEIQALMKNKFPPQNKYKYTEVDDAEIAFKMIKTNVSLVVGQLDDIRKHPKKFICLNDNIDHRQDQAKTVKAILADFYESFFPVQSQLELPREYRNRFTHIDELREWRQYRDWLKFWTHLALVLLVIFTVASYFSDKIEAAQRRFLRRRSPDNSTSSAGCDTGQGHMVITV